MPGWNYVAADQAKQDMDKARAAVDKRRASGDPRVDIVRRLQVQGGAAVRQPRQQVPGPAAAGQGTSGARQQAGLPDGVTPAGAHVQAAQRSSQLKVIKRDEVPRVGLLSGATSLVNRPQQLATPGPASAANLAITRRMRVQTIPAT